MSQTTENATPVASDTTPTAPRPRRRARFRPRAAAAVLAGRASGATLRRLRLGGGTSLPGLVASLVDPRLTSELAAQLRHGSIVVTGTNGKTTTSGLIAYVLRGAGMRVWRNREGSNLARGITTTLMRQSRLNGLLRERGDAGCVFEVDEAAFTQVARELQPRVIVVTNLFRDQLDRYGEVDTVAERWRLALAKLPPDTTLVLDADDPAVAALADALPGGRVLYYGVEDAPASADADALVQVIDTRTCPRCRGPLAFPVRFYSHIGHWRCTRCDFARPTPQVSASRIAFNALDGATFALRMPDGEYTASVALPGLYNIYNALAAAGVAAAQGIDGATAARGLGRFTPAFGRGERIAVDGRTVRILLTKNPTGLNEVLRALAADRERHHMLVVLNDRAADGEDVSWIWDADYEQIAGTVQRMSVAGTRAYDLGLRLKYAGTPPDRIEPEIGPALMAAIADVPEGGTLYVIPTYTAMLAVRGELERRGYAPRYWELEDA